MPESRMLRGKTGRWPSVASAGGDPSPSWTGLPVAHKLIMKPASVLLKTREHGPKINRITVDSRFIGQHKETQGITVSGLFGFGSISWPKRELPLKMVWRVYVPQKNLLLLLGLNGWKGTKTELAYLECTALIVFSPKSHGSTCSFLQLRHPLSTC